MTTGPVGQEGLPETGKDERRMADRDLSGLRIERPVGKPRRRRGRRYGVALLLLLLLGVIAYLYRLGLSPLPSRSGLPLFRISILLKP